jgi:hypothetical protein
MGTRSTWLASFSIRLLWKQPVFARISAMQGCFYIGRHLGEIAQLSQAKRGIATPIPVHGGSGGSGNRADRKGAVVCGKAMRHCR